MHAAEGCYTLYSAVEQKIEHERATTNVLAEFVVCACRPALNCSYLPRLKRRNIVDTLSAKGNLHHVHHGVRLKVTDTHEVSERSQFYQQQAVRRLSTNVSRLGGYQTFLELLPFCCNAFQSVLEGRFCHDQR